MKSISDFWKKKKVWLVFLIFFTLVNTVIVLLFPYILKDIIDGIEAGFTQQKLLHFVLLLGVLGVFRALFSTLLPYSRGRMNETFLVEERTSLFLKILKKGHSFTNRFPAGDVLQRLDHDLSELSWFACSGIFRPVVALITVVVALVFMVNINPWLTVLAVLPTTLAIFSWLKISPYEYKYYHSWRDKMAKVNNHLQSSFSGIKLVKSYTMEEKNHRQFKTILANRIKAAVKVIRIETLINTLFTAIEEIGIIFVLLFGGIFIIRGDITIGEFIAFNAYIIILLDPMITIGHFFVSKKRAEVQNERLEEVKNYSVDIEDKGKLKNTACEDISMNNVTFKYAKDAPLILKGIDLRIPIAKKIGLAGTVGSGKTTLINLLMRIIDPTEGAVKIGERNVNDIQLEKLRALYSYVPQESSLFSDTINNNILFGRKCSAAELSSAIKLAQLADFIKRQPKGSDELIGEKGLKLSGGEKQRIAIARAILKRPKILILDDATSNLDAETERELVNHLSATPDTTLVIISHRLSILSVCDYIYTIDNGVIVEQGTHDALLKKKGLYCRLYHHQLIEEELKK